MGRTCPVQPDRYSIRIEYDIVRTKLITGGHMTNSPAFGTYTAWQKFVTIVFVIVYTII